MRERDARCAPRALRWVHAAAVLLVLIGARRAAAQVPCEASEGWSPSVPVAGARITQPTSLRLCEGGALVTVLGLEVGDEVLYHSLPVDPDEELRGVLLLYRGRSTRIYTAEPRGVRPSCELEGLRVGGAPSVGVAPDGAVVVVWSSGSDTSEAVVCSPDDGHVSLSAVLVSVSPDCRYVAGYAPRGFTASPSPVFWVFSVERGGYVAWGRGRRRRPRWSPGHVVFPPDGAPGQLRLTVPLDP